MLKLSACLAAAAIGFGTAPAMAHYQNIYTPSPVFTMPANVPVDLIFWHPMTSGLVLDMPKPQEFFMIHDGSKTDLLPSLKPIDFAGPTNTGKSFQGTANLTTPGDYILTVVQAPFHETGPDDFYIQQFAKVVLNRGGLPTDWEQEVGLPAEIVPFTRPYNVLVGSTFSGQVLSDGMPAGKSEIDIEYIAMAPDMTSNKAGPRSVARVPGGDLVIYSDDNGIFTFGIPRAGWWSFVAVGVGPKTSMNGKTLFQDAVFWVYAQELK